MAEMRAILAELATFRGPQPQLAETIRALRGRMAPLADDARLGTELATTWRLAPPSSRSQNLRPLLENLPLGDELRAALLLSIETDDEQSANAALQVLDASQDESLDDEVLRRIGQVARTERSKLLPDKEAVVWLARRTPPQALASLVLAAFREGPEDAEDRLAATAALGRLDDARVPDWIERLIHSGAAHLECLHAVAQAVASHPASSSCWLPAVRLAVGASGDSQAAIDPWVRWTALDLLCHIESSTALPWLLASWRAAGEDLPSWYLAKVAARAVALAGGARSVEKLLADPAHAALPELAPLVGIRARTASRCPRIARRAMVEWAELHGEATAEAVARAAVERTLVERGQLLGSFLADDATAKAELDASWQPNAQLLLPTERAQLLQEEARWLGP